MVAEVIFSLYFQPVRICCDKREVETVKSSKAGIDLTEYLGEKIVDRVGNGTIRHDQRTDENNTGK